MKDVRADQTRLSFQRDEISVDFGLVSPPRDNEVEVVLSSRIVLSPAAARRLQIALSEALASRPDRRTRPVRPAGPSARPALEELLDPTGQLESSRAEPTDSARLAARIFSLVRGLGVTYGHERSFRMRREELLSNRFLLTVDRKGLGAEADTRVASIWRALGMPEDFRRAAELRLPEARSFHFGFEGDGDRPLLKVYVELAETLEAAETAPPGSDPLPLHVAYKWDPGRPERRVVSRYMLHPALPLSGIRERVGRIYEKAGVSDRLEPVDRILQLAADRMPEEDIQYLEVEEEDNDRRSFDVNLYDAELTIGDIQAPLAAMRRDLGVPPGRFQALFDQIKARRFGHVAGGVHRDGGEFVNIYHGGVFIREGAWRSAATTDPAG